MVEMCKQYKGAGIAAPQLGVPIRMFMLHNYDVLPDGQWVLGPPIFFINPKVLTKSKETNTDTEGCLSIPGFHAGPVERPNQVTVEALDLEGNTFIDEREGLNARVFFHENDHLNGVLYTDRLPPRVKKKFEPQLLKIKKSEAKSPTS